MIALWLLIGSVTVYLLVRGAYQLGKERGEVRGFESGYKFARIRAFQYQGYEHEQG